MKKLIAIFISFSVAFSGTEAFAMTEREAAQMDLTEPSGLSTEELANGLRGELAQFSAEFIAAEQKYGVNAIFLGAVAALESGWGKSCFRKNNIFGWSGKDFETKGECIDFVASKIAEHYLAESGKYHRGKNIAGVNVCYNGSEIWERKIAEIMAMISRDCGLEETFAPEPEVIFVG